MLASRRPDAARFAKLQRKSIAHYERELDSAHEIPRSELLLGTVLIARGDRAGALQHLRKYLEIVPKASGMP